MDKAEITRARSLLQRSRQITVFSGAGLSAESGIATFRNPDKDALWSKFDPTELASAEGFLANPGRVSDWYVWRRKKLAEAKPNPGHTALAQQSGLYQITQNVDNLLEQAGAVKDKIYHLHGEIIKDHCFDHCGYEETIDLNNPPGLRKCPSCQNAWMRPGVVWFGEALPSKVWADSERICHNTDVLIVIGTSASVYPAAGLISLCRSQGGKIIVINTQSTSVAEIADYNLIGPCGEILPRLFKKAYQT